tara:strand:+ start:754 stop:954 length:201 start_codon:yes stop_codon:yes gene_type:complete
MEVVYGGEDINLVLLCPMLIVALIPMFNVAVAVISLLAIVYTLCVYVIHPKVLLANEYLTRKLTRK